MTKAAAPSEARKISAHPNPRLDVRKGDVQKNDLQKGDVRKGDVRKGDVRKNDVPKGERTRESILRAAVNLASVEGLEGLTIGRLADELKMSKSGLFAHFGSKEGLQLATVEMARQIFVDYVIRPALAQPEGMPRLWALCNNWLAHVEERVFQGGCFFTAASFEFDSRPGLVRDHIVASMRSWLEKLTQSVKEAQKAGHMKHSVDAAALAFEIYSLAIGAHWGFSLLGDKKALCNVRSNIMERLRALATPKCPPVRNGF